MPSVITGANGQLGKALAPLFPEADALGRTKLDISSPRQINDFDFYGVDTVINAAAYTKVDEAETTGGRLAAWATNANGVANLASLARDDQLTLVHVSTDYVFDGRSSLSYGERDRVSPINVYGASKAAGELAVNMVPQHYLVRTSWVVGDGPNFVRTMLRLGTERSHLTVVNDQIGRPTFARDLAAVIAHLLEVEAPHGTYHFSNGGEVITWADLARAVFEEAKLDCQVEGVTTQEYFAGKELWAPRPANSGLRLDKINATGAPIPDWRDSLRQYIAEELS